MEKQGSDETLRQKVFSSIHMSTPIKSNQVTISYPLCSLCGVSASTANKKAVRKVVLFQATLYTNTSESFLVWGKKAEEPKGILWLRSCCVRRGSVTEDNSMTIELLSKGCRGRCSHTLRFTTRFLAEEWYKILKQESRKSTPMESEDPFSSGSDEEDGSPLDRILSDTRIGLEEDKLFYQPQSSRRFSSPAIKANSTPSLHAAAVGKHSGKGFRIPFGPISERKISLPTQSYSPSSSSSSLLQSSHSNELERWSLPVKVSY